MPLDGPCGEWVALGMGQQVRTGAGLRPPHVLRHPLPHLCRHAPWDHEPSRARRHEPLSVPLSNLIKAATGDGEGGGLGKTQKNLAGSTHVARNSSGAAMGLLRRREVTEEEAER